MDLSTKLKHVYIGVCVRHRCVTRVVAIKAGAFRLMMAIVIGGINEVASRESIFCVLGTCHIYVLKQDQKYILSYINITFWPYTCIYSLPYIMSCVAVEFVFTL